MMNAKKLLLIAIVPCLTAVCAYGQILKIADAADDDFAPDKGTSAADIDRDGMTDSLRYDTQKSAIVVRLSTLDFVPIALAYIPEMYPYTEMAVRARSGGFDLSNDDDRGLSTEGYLYEPSSHRFRLGFINRRQRETGKRSVQYELDLLDNAYRASFIPPCEELPDGQITSPDIEMPIENDPVYWGDPLEAVDLPGEEFFREYEAAYESVLVSDRDTVTFIGEDRDYDTVSLLGICGDELYSMPIVMRGDFNKGDLINVHYAIVCYQEPGDRAIFYARKMICEAELLEAGKLSRFYLKNRKEIDYPDDLKEDDRAAIDYFLANTKDKAVRRALRSHGKLLVGASELEGADAEEWGSDYLQVELLDHAKGRDKLVCKLILNTILSRYGTTTYSLWNAKTNAYKEWLSKDDAMITP